MADRAPGASRGALLGLVLAAALLWGSSRLRWVLVTVVDELRGTRTVDVSGSGWAAELAPLALAALAAVAAVLAVRGWLLRVVAVGVVAVGVVGALPGARVLLGGAATTRAAAVVEAGAGQVSTQTQVFGPVVAVLGGVLCAAAGVLLLRAPPRAGGLSERYQTPAARRDAAVATGSVDPVDDDLRERRLWDALDAGVDPTAATTTGVNPAASPLGDTPVEGGAHAPASLNAEPGTDRGDGGSIP